MSHIKPLSLLALAVLLAGCAFTKEQVPLYYKSQRPIAGTHYTKRSAEIRVDPVRDNRGEMDPRIIVHKRNGYNDSTTGAYLAEKPITAIVKQALDQGLNQIGYRVRNHGGQYRLQARINKVQDNIVMGFFQGVYEISMDLNLKLYDTQTHRVVWQDTIIGHGKVKTSFGSNSVLRGAFNTALNDAVHQLEQSRSFYVTLNS